ncbi:MAG: agmatinase [Candidatus Woesearchaeota archaeon]
MAIKINFGELPEEYSNYEDSKIVIVPVPFEGNISYGKGVDLAPEAIINSSNQFEYHEEETNCEPFELKIHTYRPIKGKDAEDNNQKVYAEIKKILSDNKFPIIIGGEHSISFGAIKACNEKFGRESNSFSVLQLDAHTDLREEYLGTKLSHAAIMKRVYDLGVPFIQCGIRSVSEEEIEWIRNKDLEKNIFYAYKIKGKINVDKITEKIDADNEINNKIIKAIHEKLNENVYITIDIDVIDSCLHPATGTPEPFGLDWWELKAIIFETIKNKNVVGIDIVEHSPVKGFHAYDFNIARFLYKIIGLMRHNNHNL